MTPRQQTSVVSKLKVAGVSAAVTSLLCAALPSSYASDIEIYKIPEDSAGSTTLMMMLDTSGSMDWTMAGGTTNNTSLKRIAILKKGLLEVLQGTATVPRVDDKIVMGLADFGGDTGRVLLPAKALGTVVSGQVLDGFYIKPRWQSYSREVDATGKKKKTLWYNTCANWDNNNYNCTAWSGETTKTPSGYSTSSPYQKDTNVSCNYGDYNDCLSIWEQPSKYRDKTHRDEMVTKVNGLTANGGTPTPYAYAEAAAYLMGESTVLPNITKNVPVYAKYNATSGWVCKSWNTNNDCNDWGNYTTSGYTVPAGSTSNKSCKVDGNNATCYSYNREFNNPNNAYSGLYQNKSNPDAITNGNQYIAPTSISDQKNNPAKRECSGQGIYFLTDGQPEPNGTAPGANGKSGTAYELMVNTLSTNASLFSCLDSPLGNRANDFNGAQNKKGYKDPQNAWTCTGRYAQTLLDSTKNPTGLKIQTAVVGFSDGFSKSNDLDVQDAKDWGNVGGGGWVVGTNSQDVVDSINAFITQLNKDIPSMSTGSSTIPLDELNPAVVQPYSYFPQFEPKVKPEDVQQVWFGNLKKYYVLNNGVYAHKTVADDTTVVVKKSVLQDLADIWANGDTYTDGTPVFKKGGALNRLMLGTATVSGKTQTGRKLLTDYMYDSAKDTDSRVSQDLNLTQIKYTYTTDPKTRSDIKYAPALMGLLGYVISNDTNSEGLDLSTQTATLRQMGSVYHSKPLLLTQSGKAFASRNATGKINIDTQNREDYVLFGTTQGLLQVVDADTGVEKFAFVPKEVIEHQSETFKQGGGNLAAGKNALYYGMDGEWVAHTVYVSKSDGTLTVKEASRNVPDSNKVETLNGKQWVYGGMRMGGRSYYALDLTDIDKPKVKFHIDPANGKVYSQSHPSGQAYPALTKMGQSWSKPSLGYINWQGQRKLVMIVGGGYDAGGDDGDGLKANGIRTGYAGYEDYKYNQKNKIGAGVYMFDADTGDLLWNADASSNTDLEYSIASQIRTIDRNNDGLIDHLYFGDLAGQAFRVDLKNDGGTTFTTQTTKILGLHQTNGTSPRFYTLPAFTAHSSAGSTSIFGGNTVVVTFVSGSQSSPLLATTDSSQKKDSIDLQFDGAYGIFDYDAYPSTAAGRYPSSNMAARTKADVNATTPVPTQLRYINAATTATVISKTDGWGGWYYQFNKKFDGAAATASVIKGLTTPIALEGSLYVTQFDASNNGTTSSCGAGVKGHSFAQRLCLPGGVCKEDANYTYNLGSGIVTLNVGSADGDPNKRSLVVPDPKDVCTGPDCSPCKGAACGGKKFLETGGALRFIPNRWYEKYVQ